MFEEGSATLSYTSCNQRRQRVQSVGVRRCFSLSKSLDRQQLLDWRRRRMEVLGPCKPWEDMFRALCQTWLEMPQQQPACGGSGADATGGSSQDSCRSDDILEISWNQLKAPKPLHAEVDNTELYKSDQRHEMTLILIPKSLEGKCKGIAKGTGTWLSGGAGALCSANAKSAHLKKLRLAKIFVDLKNALQTGIPAAAIVSAVGTGAARAGTGEAIAGTGAGRSWRGSSPKPPKPAGGAIPPMPAKLMKLEIPPCPTVLLENQSTLLLV